jgi:hypothetical protein
VEAAKTVTANNSSKVEGFPGDWVCTFLSVNLPCPCRMSAQAPRYDDMWRSNAVIMHIKKGQYGRHSLDGLNCADINLLSWEYLGEVKPKLDMCIYFSYESQQM